MDDPGRNRSREEGLAFFGKVMAGQSHEVTNVLNTISELAGLQKDLLGRAPDGGGGETGRIREVAGKIQRQVRRGQEIVRGMNEFAHSVDVADGVFDLRQALRQVAGLAERQARLKEVRLLAELADDAFVVQGSPLSLQQAVYSLIEIGLEAASDRRTVTVAYRTTAAGAEIAMASADPVPGRAEVDLKLAFLQEVLARFGAEMATSSVDGRVGRIVFSFSSDSRSGRAPVAESGTGR